ncbi:MAG TPA: amidase family protein [archaeon]|nr:amidase family protein [archaeon]
MMEKVLQEARELDKKFGFFISINESASEGQPIAVKDNICTAGLRTTAGSKILENYVPPFDATVIARLKKSGFSVIGKTAMDEFGFGTFSANCAYKIPKNPYNPQRACGGSSGGSAGYIAASKFTRAALAQSTGGSISCPASFCGVVGLTPTYGLVSRCGLIDYGNSLDKIGVIGKNVSDCTDVLAIIAGHDERDSTTVEIKKLPEVEVPKKIKIGVPKEYFSEGVDGKISKLVWQTIKKFESEGASYEEISLSTTRFALASYYIIAMCEASTNLAKFCGLRYGLQGEPESKGFNEYFSEIRTQGFGAEAKRRIILGTYARAAGYRYQYYLRALKVRTLVINDFRKAFKKFDLLAAPTMPIFPPKFSEIEKMTPAQIYAADVLTVPANLAGIPQISLPCGKIGKLPVGLHLLGDHFSERKIISFAQGAEKIL